MKIKLVIYCLLFVFALACFSCSDSQQTQNTTSSGQIKVKKAKKTKKTDKPFYVEIDLANSTGVIDTTRNFILIFDGSGSMGDKLNKADTEPKLAGAKLAAQEFIAKAPNDVNLGLLVFDRSGTRIVVPLGQDNRLELIGAINDIVAGGGTPLSASIKEATKALVKQYKLQLGYGEYRIVAITDGEANGIPKAADYALRRRVLIHSIGLGIEGDHPLREVSLSYEEAFNFEDLGKALEATLSEVDSFDASTFDPIGL